MKKIKKFLGNHKITGAIIILTLIYVGYQIYQSHTNTSAQTKYVLAIVKKGTVIASVTGTGQVSTTNKIELKAKASGDIVYIGTANGQTVYTGQLIAQIDNRDAEKMVRDATVALDSAKLTLAKMEKPNEQQLPEAQLAKTYQDGLSIIAKVYPDLSSVINSLNHIYFDNILDTNNNNNGNNIEYYVGVIKSYDSNFQSVPLTVQNDYTKIKLQYDQAFADYKIASLEKDNQKIDAAIRSTYVLLQNVANLNKIGHDVVQFFKNKSVIDNWQSSKPTVVDQNFTDLTADLAIVNGHLGDLGVIVNTIDSQRNNTAVNVLDIQTQKLAVEQKANTLLDAQENLADYNVRAPFDGLMAVVNIKKFDSASNGTIIGTLITKQKIAEISLNEVDVAKVKVSNKATLTFDAVDSLSITGEVQELDLIGTVTQGVVTYNIKIAFDTQDDRVKPGMSVSAAVIIDMRQDVLTVPISAVKGTGNSAYVEVFNQPLLDGQGSQGVASLTAPQQKNVVIGLTDDTLTEIISGLKDGDQVVSRTITGAAVTTAATAPSLFGGGGGRIGGGGHGG